MTRTLDVAGTVISMPDPDEITTLSGRFQVMGDALADVHDQLSALASPQASSQWTGSAADAFRQTIGQLPGQLGAAQESYHEVAAALSDYADQMRPVVAMLSSLANQADDAVANLTATQTARDQAVSSISVMTPTPGPDLTGFDLRVTAARAAVVNIQSQVRNQQSELKTLATRCATRIEQALPGHRKHPGFLSELGGLGRGVWDAFDAVIIEPFAELPDDVGKLRHDFNLANFGKTLGDVAGVLGVIALVTGVGWLAVPFVLASFMAAAADAEAARKHEDGASYTEAASQAAGGLLGGAGRVVGKAGEGLANGADARASAGALFKSGVTHFVDWPEVKASLKSVADRAQLPKTEASGITVPSSEQLRTALTKVSDAVTGRVTELLHAGADGESTRSSAATIYQHLAFISDRADELITVEQHQLDHSSQPTSTGSAQ